MQLAVGRYREPPSRTARRHRKTAHRYGAPDDVRHRSAPRPWPHRRIGRHRYAQPMCETPAEPASHTSARPDGLLDCQQHLPGRVLPRQV